MMLLYPSLGHCFSAYTPNPKFPRYDERNTDNGFIIIMDGGDEDEIDHISCEF